MALKCNTLLSNYYLLVHLLALCILIYYQIHYNLAGQLNPD